MESESKKKKLIQINTVCNNSTGRIMYDIQAAAIEAGYDTLSIVGRRKTFTDVPCVKYGNGISFWIHVAITTLFDKQGWGSYFETKRIVNRLRKEKPDIIHLHNIHGYYINIPVLFRYLNNEYKGKLFWTFHDCWPFTGHCPYYVVAGCDRWETGCFVCPNKKQYPISLFLDSSRSNYIWKEKHFKQLENITVCVPSIWLHQQIVNSFFRDIHTEIVENGIDFSVFHPKAIENVKRKYGLSSERIILGVASIWEKRKGLDDFVRISKEITNEYKIILVGLTKGQCHHLPDRIYGIERTNNRQELADLYSVADVFINPSMEETFSLVTVEALSCGTPVIVRNGSAPKELVNEKCGIVLLNNSTDNYIDAIKHIMQMTWDKNEIAEQAKKYSVQNMTNKIINLYRGSQNE